MLPIIPDQRKFDSGRTERFNDLIKYIQTEVHISRNELQNQNDFSNVLNYALATSENFLEKEKCIAVQLRNLVSITSAVREMNHTALQNPLCKDPVYHFILSWPEHEKPDNAKVFDAATHALNRLGLSEHQAVIAIHGNTDNLHCHVAVSRINPNTCKSHHIEWSEKTLHFAARESEIKHGWSHDNGLYIVGIENGIKTILPNKELGLDRHNLSYLPTWRDHDSLEAWLKTTVAKHLKQDLQLLPDWDALHTWLYRHSIELKDSGGGGLKLYATSADGEVLTIAASKVFRFLKSADMEKAWGPFHPRIERVFPDMDSLGAENPDLPDITLPDVHLDFSSVSKPHLKEVSKNVTDQINDYRKLGAQGVPFPRIEHGGHIITPKPNRSVYGVPSRSLAGKDKDAGMLLPGDALNHLGDGEAGNNFDVRRAAEHGRESRESTGIQSLREIRKVERKEARIALLNKFNEYRETISVSESAIKKEIRTIREERSKMLAHLDMAFSDKVKQIRQAPNMPNLLPTIKNLRAALNDAKTEIRAEHLSRIETLKQVVPKAFTWREWLLEQANQGDQAALSALRGIVYRERRDAKHGDVSTLLEKELIEHEKHKKLLSLLLEEEQKEKAIRAARFDMIRPYQVDSIIQHYTGLQFHCTENGNVAFLDEEGKNIFMDRGNRITFDRVMVTDSEMRLALLHSKYKFGDTLLITGQDDAFSRRLAVMADSMGMKVINPELQPFVEYWKTQLRETSIQVQPEVEVPAKNIPDVASESISPAIAEHEAIKEPEQNEIIKANVHKNENDVGR